MFGSYGSIVGFVDLDTTKLDMGVTKAAAGLKGLEAGTAGVGKAFKALAVGGATVGVVIAGAAIKMAADFDQSMRKVWSLTTESESSFKKWGDQVKEMSRDLPQSAQQMAEAFYWIKSDMPDATDAEQFATLEIAAKGAVGGLADLSDTTEALIGVQNAYKDQDPTKYINIMIQAVERGSITLQDFVANQGKFVNTAANFNIPFKEVAAAFATLTKNAVPAETAAMAINQTMMAYLKPTQEAVDIAKAHGIELSANTLKTKGFGGAMMDVANVMQDDNSELAKIFPNIRALKAVLPLTGLAAKEFAKDLSIIGDGTDALTPAFERNKGSLQNIMKTTWGKFQLILIDMGEKLLPKVESALNTLGRVFDGKNAAFNAFGEIIKKAAGAVWDITGALKQMWPVLLGVGAAIAAFKIYNLVSAITSATTVIPLLNTLLSGGLVGSLGAVALGAAPTVIALGYLIDRTRQQNAAAKAGAEGFAKMQESQGALAASTIPLVQKLEDVQKKQAEAAAGSQEYINATQEVRDVQNQIAANFPSLASGWDLERNAIFNNTAELRKQLEYRMEAAGVKAPTPGAPPEYQSMEVMLSQSERASKNYGTMFGMVNQLTEALGKAGIETEDLGYVSDAWYRSAEEGTKVTTQLLDQFTGYGVEAIPGFSEANRLMGDLNSKSTIWGGTLGFLNSQIVTSGQQWDTAVQGMVDKAAAAGAATGAIPKEVALSYASSIPAFQSAGVQAFSAFLSATSQGRIDPGAAAGLAQQLFNTGTFTATGVAAVDAALSAMAGQVKVSKLSTAAAEMAQGLKAAFDLGGLGLDKEETKKVSIKVSDGGTGASTAKSIAQVGGAAKNLDGTVAAVRQTDHGTGGSVLASLQQVARYANGTHPVMHISVVYDKAAVPGSALHYFGTNQEAGKFAQQKFQEGLNSGGGVKGTVIYGGGMTGGGPTGIMSALKELEAAYAGLNATALVGWSRDVDNAKFGEIEQAIMNLAPDGKSLDAWRLMRKEYDESKAALDVYSTALDASTQKQEAMSHQQELLQRQLQGYQKRLQEVQSGTDKWRDATGKLHLSLQTLSQIKLTGQTAREDLSFSETQQLNKLELERLQIQQRIQAGKGTEADYQRLFDINKAKQQLELQKQIDDLATSTKYDPLQKSIKDTLDPLHGVERSQAQILADIKAGQAEQNKYNKLVDANEAAQNKITAAMNKEKDSARLMRLEYDAMQKSMQNLETVLSGMMSNFEKHFQAMKTAAEAAVAAAKAADSDGGAPPRYALGGRVDETGIIYAHEGEEVLTPREATLWRQMKAPGYSMTTTDDHSRAMNVFNFDKLVLPSVTDGQGLMDDLRKLRTRQALP